MIIVTGTKRSGTSMWMAALSAGGFEPIGKAFPGIWGETIREANSGGFFESLLRHGIHHGTNPNPQTGRYIHHEQTRGMAVKIFAGGFVRTHRAFVDHVVFTVRPWREYVASLTRLYAMEHAAAEERLGARLTPRVVPRPELEWWVDNFLILEDLQRRNLPHDVVTYDNALSDPNRHVGETIGRIGGDGEAAKGTILAERRTQTRAAQDEAPDLPRHTSHVYDRLYDLLNAGSELEPSFWSDMRKLQSVIAPEFMKDVHAARADRERWANDVRRLTEKEPTS
jgi:hypothetical protein